MKYITKYEILIEKINMNQNSARKYQNFLDSFKKEPSRNFILLF